MGKIGFVSAAVVYGKYMSEESLVFMLIVLSCCCLFDLIKNCNRNDFYKEWKIATISVIIGALFCVCSILCHICFGYNGYFYRNYDNFMWGDIILIAYFHYRGLIVDLKRNPTSEKINRIKELKKAYCIILICILLIAAFICIK